MRTIVQQWGAENIEQEPIVLTGRDARSIADAFESGDEINIESAWLCNDIKPTGEAVDVLYIYTGTELVCTNSKTFISDFVGLLNWAEEKHYRYENMVAETGASKKGRTFYRCSPGKLVKIDG